MTTTGYLRYPHLAGERVVFTAEDDLWLASTAGGLANRLTADRVPVSHPRLSADGATVAWLSRRNGEPEVFAMPTEGGQPRQLTFFGHPNTAVLGFAPDGRLIVCSAGSQPFRTSYWAYAIDLSDDAYPSPQRLPYGPVNAVAHSAAGPVVVGTGNLRDYAHWKRYRGGTASRLWLAAEPAAEFSEFLPQLAGPKTYPNWLANRLAFLADFEGHGNVYSVSAEGGDLRRHTDHAEHYARQLTGDGSRLVYQRAGQLWLLDGLAADSQPRRLEVELASPRAGRAPAEVSVAGQLGDIEVDRTGRASVVEVRGSIVLLTHRNGPARVLASTPGVRYRQPVILPGTSEPADPSEVSPAVAYLTDAEGADAVEILDLASSGPVRRLAAGQLGRVQELAASPDGRLLALASHDGRLLSLDRDGVLTELDRTVDGDLTGLAFSTDSRWLAYAAEGPTSELSSIRLVEFSTGTVTQLTERRFDDREPVFSLDGKYLAFLSARTFDPVYDAQVFDLAFPLATRPYLVTLAADTPSPFDPELAGQPAQSEKPAAPGRSAEPDQPVRVDLDSIGDRIVPFPVAAGRLADLLPVKNGFVWTNAPITGELGESRDPDEDVRPRLQRWDYGKRALIELAEHVDHVRASGDGTVLVVSDHDKLRVVPADRRPAEDGSDTVQVDLGRVRLTVQPPAEWAQMLDETGRLMAEHFWTEDMAGIDWPAAVARYRPLIDRLGSRDDLSDVLWELNGETGSSHAYETPRPAKKDPLLQPAYLGADLARQPDGGWTISRVLHGDNSARLARSPLTAPGAGVEVGDRIVAVNGRPVGPAGPAPLLRGTAGKPVELQVSGSAGQRSVIVVPLPADTELRYLDWVAERRARVHAAGAGRIGYLHVPDMVATGWAAFHRDLRVEMDRDALIVDTRNNAGGHTSQLVIEKLARRVIGWNRPRHRAPVSYPQGAPRGPLVSLANEWAGSDGDIVNAAFQSLGLGPVIGTRTWGGVIGIDSRYKLVDGTSVTQPRFSFWFERFGWSVENYGIDPDQVVELPPHAWGADSDPQLAAGIDYLLAELARRPAPLLPDLADRPSRRAPELPPRP